MNNIYTFKAKRIDNGEWAVGYLWKGNDHSYIIPYNVGVLYDDAEKRLKGFAYEIDPSTICRSTGFKDKNGIMIWEHDMVKDCDGEIGIIKYNATESPFAAFCIFYNNLWVSLGETTIKKYNLEIIGSSFDNRRQ